MNLSFSLTRTLTYPTLMRILPALLQAESVVFLGSPSQLLCRGTPQQLAELESRLAATLMPLDVEWESDSVVAAAQDADDRQLFALSTSVLTVVLPDACALPYELLTALMGWDVELRAMRRLSSAGDKNELAMELYLDSPDDCAGLRAALPALSQRYTVDLLLTPSESKRPRRRLIAFDMDSTLLRCEVIDELAARVGAGEAVADITARAMRGELDFRSSFRERMAKLRGLPEPVLQSVAETLPLMPGAMPLLRTLRAQGHYAVILSGGFDYFARHLQQLLGFHEVHANALQIDGGELTGEVNGEIVDGDRKVALLREIAAAQGFDERDTVAVGDGANDLPMLAAAGLGVAFHPKPVVRKAAQCSLEHADLTGLLYVLGVARGDF